MTLNAAVTYADRGIRVNAVLPGLIDTEMVRDQDPAMRAETIGNTPMKRIGTPENDGNAAADRAGFAQARANANDSASGTGGSQAEPSEARSISVMCQRPRFAV